MRSTSKPCIRVPCQKCENCVKKDCGKCKSCKDNKKSHASGSTGKIVPKSPGKSPSRAAKKTRLKICEERACLEEQCTTFCEDPCPYSGKHHEILYKILKTNNRSVNDDRSKLKLFKDCVEKYVKKGWNCDGQSVPDESPKLRYPIMHLTVMFGKTQALNWLLQQGFKPLHTCKDQQPDPGSPLHLAVTSLKDGVKNLKIGNDGLVKVFAQIVDLFLIHSPPSFTHKHPQSQDSFLHFLARRCLEKEEDLPKEYLLTTLQKLKEYHGKVKMVNIKEVLCAKNAEGNTLLHLVVQDNSLHDVVKYLATNFDAEFKVMSSAKNNADDTPREIAAEKKCIKICEALGAPAELIQLIAQGNATGEEDKKMFTPNIDKETEAKRKRSESEKNETPPKRRRVGEAEEQANNSSTSKKQADTDTQTKKKTTHPKQSKKQIVDFSQSKKQIDNTKQTEQSSDSKISSDSSSHAKKQIEQSCRSKRSSDCLSYSKKQIEQSSPSKRSSDSSSHSKKQIEQSSRSKRSSDSSSASKKQTEQSSDSKRSSDSSSHSKKQTEQSGDSKRSSDSSSHSKKQTEQSSISKRFSDSSNHIKKEAEPSSQRKQSSDSSSQSKEQGDQSRLVKEHPDISSQGKDTDDSGQSKRSNEQSLGGNNQTDNSNQKKKQVEQLSHSKKAESPNQSKKALDESSQSKRQFDNSSSKQVDNSSQHMKQADQSSHSKEDDKSDDVSQMEVDDDVGDITDDVTPQPKEDTEDDCAVCKRSTPPTNEDVTGDGSAIQTTRTHTVFCPEECVARHSKVLQLLHRCNNSPHNSCNNIPSFMQVLDEYLHREGRRAAHRPIPDTVKEFRHPIVHWASVLGKYQLLNYLAKRKDFNLSVSNLHSDNETAIHRTLLFLEEALTRADPAVSMERIFAHFSKVADVFAREAPVVFGKQNADGDTPFHLVAKAIMEVGQNRQLKCYDKFFKIMLQKVTDMAKNSRPQFEKVKEMMCKTNSEGETFLHILTCRVGIGHELCIFTLKVLPEEILIRLKKIETRYGKSASDIAADLGSYKLAALLSHEMSSRKMSTASDTPVQSPSTSRAERAARRQDVRVAQWFEENQSWEESEFQNDTAENQSLQVNEGEVMSPVFLPQSKSFNKRKLSLDDLSDVTLRARTKKQVFSFSPSHDRSSPISDSSGEVWSPGGIDSEEEETYAPAELGEIVASEEYQEMDISEEHEETELEETEMPICKAESRKLPAESNDPIHSTVVVDSGSEVAASSSVKVLKTEKGDDSSEGNVTRRSAELKTESVQDAGTTGESQVTSTSPRVHAVFTKSSGLSIPTSSRSKGDTVYSTPIPKSSSADQSSDTTSESTPSQSSTKNLAKSARRNTSSKTNQPTPSVARTKACIISGIMRSPHTPLVKQSIVKSLQSQFKSTLENAKKSLKEKEEQLQSIRTKCVDAEEKKKKLLLQISELDKTISETMDEEKKCQDLCKTKKEECKQFEMELEKCEVSLQDLAASI